MVETRQLETIIMQAENAAGADWPAKSPITGAPMPARLLPENPAADEQASRPLAGMWALKRNCSVTPSVFMASSGVILTPPLFFAVFFLIKGLWPITVFCGAEMVGLMVAFLAFARHAMDGERVWLFADGQLVVEVTDGRHCKRHVLNAAWARLDIDAQNPGHLWLCQGKIRLRLGRHVRTPQREAFGRELRKQLRDVRSGYPLWN
jgi:uncharacterized membrane protein